MKERYQGERRPAREQLGAAQGARILLAMFALIQEALEWDAEMGLWTSEPLTWTEV